MIGPSAEGMFVKRFLASEVGDEAVDGFAWDCIFSQGEAIRVRVEADEFYDDEPGPPKAAEGVQIKREPRRPPYTIIVSPFSRI